VVELDASEEKDFPPPVEEAGLVEAEEADITVRREAEQAETPAGL